MSASAAQGGDNKQQKLKTKAGIRLIVAKKDWKNAEGGSHNTTTDRFPYVGTI